MDIFKYAQALTDGMISNQKYRWDYSAKSDIFNIHRIGVKTKGSAEIGDFTLDFDARGNVIGLEIVYASEFLGNLGITSQDLIAIKNAEIKISQKQPDLALLFLKLTLPGKEEIIPIPAPVQTKSLLTI